jgi:hypothetical protein
LGLLRMATARFLFTCLAFLWASSPSFAADLLHPSPAGARLFAVPVMQPGKDAWVSVYDQAGKPVNGVHVFVNDSPHDTDGYGQCGFTVPAGSKLILALKDAAGKEFCRTEYAVSPGGLYVNGNEAVEVFDRLTSTINPQEVAPVISYAPAVLETKQPFIVVGKNFSGKVDGDHLFVDGYEADVFSGSGVAILSTAPRKLDLGPLRELYVASASETSNTVEVDICRVEVTKYDDAAPPAPNAKLRVIGTNLPALVEIQNDHPDVYAIANNGVPIGPSASFVTPGGEQNTVPLTIRERTAGGAITNATIDTHLVADAPWSPDDKLTFCDPQLKRLVTDLTRAQIIRLKRRLLALESRLNEAQEKRTATSFESTSSASSATQTPAEVENGTAELRALALRQKRMTGMLTARHGLFLALGGQDDDYRLALDEAAGGAFLSLEKSLHSADITAKMAILVKNTPVPPAAALAEDNSEVDALIPPSVATLSKIWKSFPSKPPRGARLSAPPEPYMPDVSQLGLSGQTYDFAKFLQANSSVMPAKHVAVARTASVRSRGRHAKRGHHYGRGARHHRRTRR